MCPRPGLGGKTYILIVCAWSSDVGQSGSNEALDVAKVNKLTRLLNVSIPKAACL